MKKISKTIATSAGILFLLAGVFKVLAAVPGESPMAGRRAFAQMLLQINVPLPFITAAIIPALEIIGGIGLITGRGARIWAALLAIDMIGALFLVGIPGKSGRTVTVGDTTIGGEPWRLPLEIALMLMMVWVALAPVRPKQS